MSELSVPNTSTGEAVCTLPVDLSLPAENLEIGDWYTYLYMEQEAHKLAHQDVTLPTQCVVCHSLFSTRTIAREHFEKHHGGRLFECRFCRLTFALECNLQQHNELHHGFKLAELNKPGIALEQGSKASRLEVFVEGLLDDVVDAALKPNDEMLYQKNISTEGINSHYVNEMELNATVTNEQINASKTTCDNEDQAPNDQCENEKPTIVTARRQLKFKDKKQEKAEEGMNHRWNINHRNLYIQRHNKNLKKLRDVILKCSPGKRRDTTSIRLQGMNGKTAKKTQNKNVAQAGGKERISESIKTTDCYENILEKDQRTSVSKSIVTTDEGNEYPKTQNDDMVSKIKQIEHVDELPENAKEDVTAESTPSTTTICADASVSQDANDPPIEDMAKDTTASRESNSKDGRLWCIPCNISFKTSQTLRKHTLYSLCHKINTNEEPPEREICYDCASTFANKNYLVKHKRLTCPFRIKIFQPIQTPESYDVDGNIHYDTSKTPTSCAHTSAWKSLEKNTTIDGLSTSHVPGERNKEQNNTYVQQTKLAKNLVDFTVDPPCGKNKGLDKSTNIQNQDTPQKSVVAGIRDKNQTENNVAGIPKANPAAGKDSGDIPSHESLHDSSTIDREQTSQNLDIPQEPVPKYFEKEGSAKTIIMYETDCVKNSTTALDSNGSNQRLGIENQTKIITKKQKYIPTECDGCGSTFSSRKSCRRHILNSCPFYIRVRKTSPKNSEYAVEIDPRKSWKRPSCVLPPAFAEKMPKLQITCKDCGKQFSRKGKYRKHARKHADLPKLQPELPKDPRLSKIFSKEGQVREQNDPRSKASFTPKKLFQCFKCYRYFLTDYALKIHSERFCCSKKIDCPAAITSSLALKKVGSLFEYSKFNVTVKCCICLKLFATRTECYRHLTVIHRLSRRKAVNLEREYLGQQILLNYDLMMDKKCSNISDIIIPAVNLGLRWNLEPIDFPDSALGINNNSTKLRSN